MCQVGLSRQVQVLQSQLINCLQNIQELQAHSDTSDLELMNVLQHTATTVNRLQWLLQQRQLSTAALTNSETSSNDVPYRCDHNILQYQ